MTAVKGKQRKSTGRSVMLAIGPYNVLNWCNQSLIRRLRGNSWWNIFGYFGTHFFFFGVKINQMMLFKYFEMYRKQIWFNGAHQLIEQKTKWLTEDKGGIELPLCWNQDVFWKQASYLTFKESVTIVGWRYLKSNGQMEEIPWPATLSKVRVVENGLTP